jgi:hypothetical protein
MTTAEALLRALADGRDREAWEHGQGLAKGVLDDQRNVLAGTVLEAGPFAMRKAEELAELVLADSEDGATAKPTTGS